MGDLELSQAWIDIIGYTFIKGNQYKQELLLQVSIQSNTFPTKNPIPHRIEETESEEMCCKSIKSGESGAETATND